MADRGSDQLAVLEHEVAPELLHAGNVFDRGAHDPRIAAVAARHEPVAGALEDVQAGDALNDLGDELHGARARADDRDTLALEWVVVVPLRRVEAVAGEAVCPRDRGVRGLVQLAGREHERVGLEALALGRVDCPQRALLVPCARADRLTAAHVAHDVVFARDIVQVVVDLSLWRAQPRPVAPLGEGERVQVARHVARRAGVAVVEPRAAQLGRALEDCDLLEAVALELDRGGDAAEAGADDQHRWLAPRCA